MDMQLIKYLLSDYRLVVLKIFTLNIFFAIMFRGAFGSKDVTAIATYSKSKKRDRFFLKIHYMYV